MVEAFVKGVERYRKGERERVKERCLGLDYKSKIAEVE